MTDRDEEIELVIPPVFNYCTKVLDPNEQIAARDLYWEAICSDDRKDRDWEKVEKVLLESIKASFGRASGAASRAAPGEALPNVCFVTGFTREAGPKAIGGLHRQYEAIKSWLHAAYTSI